MNLTDIFDQGFGTWDPTSAGLFDDFIGASGTGFL